MTLQVSIMTPDRLFFNDQAEEIVLPSNTGQMGVLTNHAPLMTALDIGVMLIRKSTEWTSVALMGGFALVQQNQVTVLVNEAESPESVNPEEAEKACSEATERWSQASGQKQRVEANLALKRARARYQLVKRN